MDLVTVRELYRNREEYLDKEVTIGGWVRSIRDSKTFGFIVVNDGSFFENLQVVYHDNMENFGEISKLNVGAAIIVKGTLVATPQAKQPFEIQATEVVVEGTSAPDYPLQKKRHSLEYLRTITHLRPRTNHLYGIPIFRPPLCLHRDRSKFPKGYPLWCTWPYNQPRSPSQRNGKDVRRP